MPKRLSERAAWLLVADTWENAGYDGTARVMCGLAHFGICATVMYLQRSDQISKNMAEKLENRLKKNLPGKGTYRFPNTPGGARKRAAFCRKMAALCVKSKKKGAKKCQAKRK